MYKKLLNTSNSVSRGDVTGNLAFSKRERAEEKVSLSPSSLVDSRAVILKSLIGKVGTKG